MVDLELLAALHAAANASQVAFGLARRAGLDGLADELLITTDRINAAFLALVRSGTAPAAPEQVTS